MPKVKIVKNNFFSFPYQLKISCGYIGLNFTCVTITTKCSFLKGKINLRIPWFFFKEKPIVDLVFV